MSNRQHRRANHGHKQPVIMVGDNVVATSLGQQYEAIGGAQLAPKIPGKHRMIATAAYVLTDDQATAMTDNAALKVLGPDSLMYLGIGCWDCEQVLGEAGPVCPAPGDPRDG